MVAAGLAAGWVATVAAPLVLGCLRFVGAGAVACAVVAGAGPGIVNVAVGSTFAAMQSGTSVTTVIAAGASAASAGAGGSFATSDGADQVVAFPALLLVLFLVSRFLI